jgi:hypothetical protein
MSFLREPNAEPIPGYRLIEPLGSGGFGEAWKCEAPGGLFKAIKFVFGNLNSLDVDGVRAEQERKALNRVKEVRHPFVLSMDRIEEVSGELVIVMELADKSLHDRFEECVQAGMVGIPRDELMRYIRDAAEALDHMNEKHNLQHLDIKPRNLFLVSDRVKVADFGLVKHLERNNSSGMLAGVTPLYAPPETFSGAINGRSDQYSLAIVYQELLTGQRPFTGKNARQLAHQHINEEPELRSLPEAERPMVARALSKDPNKRFPNCLAFVRALYTARSAGRPDVAHAGASNNRPKTMADTMEDMVLEQLPIDDQLVPVDSPDPSPVVDEVSKLGLTVALPQTGALRPTLVIGLGTQGRRALQELRCRFIDRFGDLDKVPLFRFLYIDSDTDAIKESLRGAPELAFKPGEVYHLPLQPVAHYRRRQLDQLNDWLPREKLYTMPRALKTQGSRALGRLAFSDNYQRLMARLRREVQQASHPDALYHTVSQTGLALRDNVPRVYVVAGASGGASGYLADLGYAVRRLLHQLRHEEAAIVSLLFCGAPEDPATPAVELANLYATLTELNHFADPTIPFSAQYGTDGPRLHGDGQPFDSTYLLPYRHRTPEGRRNTIAHLGSYLFHEMTTPLGLRLDRIRQKLGSADLVAFRSLGTYGIWFPRGLLLRLAAQRACKTILEEWQAVGEPTAQAELEAAQARIFADPELTPEALTTRIISLAGDHLEESPSDLLTRLLSSLEEQSQQMVALDDPGAWARQAVTRVKDWLGSGLAIPGAAQGSENGSGFAIGQRKSKLTKSLEAAATKLATEWDERLTDAATALMEHPGRRVAVAEAAMARFSKFCDEAAAALAARVQLKASRTNNSELQLQDALENCIRGAGGFSWFGGKARRLLRVFMDHLAAFARQCLADDTTVAVLHFFAGLRGRLADRLRDLTFCRQRLRHVQENLEIPGDSLDDHLDSPPGSDLSNSMTPMLSTESFWDNIRESTTARVVLPEGQEDLDRAAATFLKTLQPDQWVQLDQAINDHVLVERGGLFRACLATNDLQRYLVPALLSQVVTALGNHLPVTDVAQLEMAPRASQSSDIAARIQSYHDQAAPLLASTAKLAVAEAGRSSIGQLGDGPAPSEEHSFLLIPASEAGKAYGDEAAKTLTSLHLVNVPGQADLMFCREQDSLRVEDLERILRTCRRHYEERATLPNTSPHSRFDIQDWTPLDP